MVRYATQISWVLIATFVLSALYELYRSTGMTVPAGPSGRAYRGIRISRPVPLVALHVVRLYPGGRSPGAFDSAFLV
jgi:hypothetical protein